jgi:hypothetical protein
MKRWLTVLVPLAMLAALAPSTAAQAATASASHDAFTYTGTWTRVSTEHYSNDVSTPARASINFTASAGGSTFSLKATRNGANHLMSVAIDGGSAATVNLYSSTSQQGVTVYTSPVLAAGGHTAVVTVTQAYGSVAGAALSNGVFGGPGFTGGGTPPPPPPSGWTQTFAEDFNAAPNSTTWNVYSGGRSGASNAQWAGSHVTASGGLLNMNVSRDSAYGNERVAAGIAQRSFTTYGKWEVRARIDAGKGVAFALGLWPQANTWPPEIDFTEDNGANPRTTVYGTLHYGANGQDNQVGVNKGGLDLTQWHVWSVEWSPGKLVFLVDGTVWGTVSNSNVTAQNMGLFMQAEPWVQGVSPNSTWEQYVDSSTPASVNLQIDWVREYKAA